MSPSPYILIVKHPNQEKWSCCEPKSFSGFATFSSGHACVCVHVCERQRACTRMPARGCSSLQCRMCRFCDPTSTARMQNWPFTRILLPAIWNHSRCPPHPCLPHCWQRGSDLHFHILSFQELHVSGIL